MANTSGIRAGKAFVELGVSDKLSSGLKAAQKKLEAFGEGLRSVGIKMAGIGAAAVTGLLGAVKHFSDAGDALEKMSRRTGVSVEALSELSFAAEQSGADAEALEGGLRHMQKAVVEAAKGSEGAVLALDLLHLTLNDLANLTPEQQFKLIADRLSQVKDPAVKAALAMEIFGKSGTRLIPLMDEGAKGIEELQKQARDLGLTVSSETAKDAAELNDTLNILWRVLKQGVFTIGSALSPLIKSIAESITRVVVNVTAWIRQNKEMVVWALKVAAAIVVAGVALIALGWVIGAIGTALGVVAAVIGGIGTVFGVMGAMIGALLSPVGLVIAAIVALGTALVITTGVGSKALDWLSAKFGELKDWVSEVVGGIADALAAGDIALAAEILWLALKVIWQQGVAALNKAWLSAKEFFVSTAYSMWYGALAAAEIVFHALEVAWIETTAFLSKTWTNFATGFQMIWEEASSWVAKRMLEIQGLFDSGLDVDAAKKNVDQQLESRLVELENQAQQDVANREKQRAMDRKQSGDVHDATMAQIGQGFEDAQKELKDKTDAELAQSQADLEAAKQRLADAIAEAKRKRENMPQTGPGRTPDDLMSRFNDGIASLSDLMGRQVSVRGTFNSAALSGLGAGSDAPERTAKATEQTAKNTKKVADAVGNGGLTFA
jgi:hypothetical protein